MAGGANRRDVLSAGATEFLLAQRLCSSKTCPGTTTLVLCWFCRRQQGEAFSRGGDNFPQAVEIGDLNHLVAVGGQSAEDELSLARVEPLPGLEQDLDEGRAEERRVRH